MGRRAVLVVGIYAALVLSLATPLYRPLSSGRDDSWALLVLLAAAQLGLGAAIRRPWVLTLPVALSILAFAAAGADDLAWLAILIGAPALVARTAVGWAVCGGVEQQSDVIAGVSTFLSRLAAAWAVVETT